MQLRAWALAPAGEEQGDVGATGALQGTPPCPLPTSSDRPSEQVRIYGPLLFPAQLCSLWKPIPSCFITITIIIFISAG